LNQVTSELRLPFISHSQQLIIGTQIELDLPIDLHFAPTNSTTRW